MNFLKYLPNFFKMENYVYGENIIISQFTVVLITISYKYGINTDFYMHH